MFKKRVPRVSSGRQFNIPWPKRATLKGGGGGHIEKKKREQGLGVSVCWRDFAVERNATTGDRAFLVVYSFHESSCW